MKKLIPFLFLMFILLTAGCKKDSKDNTDPEPTSATVPAGELHFTYDNGIAKKNIVYKKLNVNVVKQGMMYRTTIAEVNDAYGEFEIQIDGDRVAKEFPLFGYLVLIRYSPSRLVDTTPLNRYASENCREYNGSIKITEFDIQNKVISGTFSGTLCSPFSGPKTEVSGSFNKLQYK